MKAYYVGICKGGGYDGHGKRTLIVQLRTSVDYLSCELWEYYGLRETSRKDILARKAQILAAINAEKGTNYRYLVVD